MKKPNIKIPAGIQRKFGRQLLKAQKHSPEILLVTGIVGMVGSTVLACRATLKIEDILDHTNKEAETAKNLDHEMYSEMDRKRDLSVIYTRSAIDIARLYAPAIGLATLSICAIGGSHQIMSRRNAGLAAAYAAVEKGFEEYRKRVQGELGEEREEQIYYKSEEHKVKDEETGKKVVEHRVGPDSPSIYARFFDQTRSSWTNRPEYNMVFLRNQQNWANDKLHAQGHLFLNEVYDMLGIERTKAGSVVGWVIGKGKNAGDNYVDFGLFDGDRPAVRDFVNGHEGAILLDFNVDGVIYDKI